MSSIGAVARSRHCPPQTLRPIAEGHHPSLMFTFEHLVPHCVASRNRHGLSLRGGEMGNVPVVLVVEDDEPLQEIVHDALKAAALT